MHLIVALGVATDVAVGVHLRAPPLLGPGEVQRGVLRGVRNGGRDIGHLTLGIGIEVGALTVVPPQHIAHIGRAPTGQRHTPAHTAVEPRLTVPVAIGSKSQGAA